MGQGTRIKHRPSDHKGSVCSGQISMLKNILSTYNYRSNIIFHVACSSEHWNMYTGRDLYPDTGLYSSVFILPILKFVQTYYRFCSRANNKEKICPVLESTADDKWGPIFPYIQ